MNGIYIERETLHLRMINAKCLEIGSLSADKHLSTRYISGRSISDVPISMWTLKWNTEKLLFVLFFPYDCLNKMNKNPSTFFLSINNDDRNFSETCDKWDKVNPIDIGPTLESQGFLIRFVVIEISVLCYCVHCLKSIDVIWEMCNL